MFKRCPSVRTSPPPPNVAAAAERRRPRRTSPHPPNVAAPAERRRPRRTSPPPPNVATPAERRLRTLHPPQNVAAPAERRRPHCTFSPDFLAVNLHHITLPIPSETTGIQHCRYFLKIVIPKKEKRGGGDTLSCPKSATPRYVPNFFLTAGNVFSRFFSLIYEYLTSLISIVYSPKRLPVGMSTPFPNQSHEEHPEEESEPSPLSIAFHEDEVIRSSWWACESEATQQPDSEMTDDSLLCHEVLYPFTSIGESSLQPHYPDSVDSNKDQFKIISTTYGGFPTLDDINTDTQSDFHISSHIDHYEMDVHDPSVHKLDMLYRVMQLHEVVFPSFWLLFHDQTSLFP
ncbi:hypothetical protein KSP39_PZI017134 [Platanthera zijinensis]|uniref:Uncharacterized protein n=1 Tax=Platanthera zijinensis TaxID=2320716 RepID=A0AAP0B6B2_9ASPA